MIKMNILIVEDDKYQRKNIKQSIESIKKEINIYEASNGGQALEKIEAQEIDLFILDIELPDISGLEIAEKIRKISKHELTHIIFITTHIYFQLDAFKEIHCYDFLEKPYKRVDLIKNIERLYRGFSNLNDISSENFKRSIFFEMKDYLLKIYLEDILFLESQLRHIKIHTKDKEYLVKNISIKKVLEKIASKEFIQIHRAYVVNMNNIKEIIKDGSQAWEVKFKSYEKMAYVGKTYKAKFNNEFEEYKKRCEVK